MAHLTDCAILISVSCNTKFFWNNLGSVWQCFDSKLSYWYGTRFYLTCMCIYEERAGAVILASVSLLIQVYVFTKSFKSFLEQHCGLLNLGLMITCQIFHSKHPCPLLWPWSKGWSEFLSVYTFLSRGLHLWYWHWHVIDAPPVFCSLYTISCFLNFRTRSQTYFLRPQLWRSISMCQLLQALDTEKSNFDIPSTWRK